MLCPIEFGFFTVMAPPFYHTKVNARDGATNNLTAHPGVELTEAKIELHQATLAQWTDGVGLAHGELHSE